MLSSLGVITLWGFSPGVDFQELGFNAKLEHFKLDNENTSTSEWQADTLNLLLVGCGDPRHIIKTIAHSSRWPRRQINIYIVENNLEVLARHMLLLSLIYEPPETMGLQEKMELFLELFGNTLVRNQTDEYLKRKADELIKTVTDFDYLKCRLPFLDISNLKFAERDHLETIFKFWKNASQKMFDISIMWEHRLRKHLSGRYDSRRNIYDWDYNMNLKTNADIIRSHEYANWRESGVAFEIREANYNIANKSLASGVILSREGERHQVKGYWGDILNSPYIAYGIESEEQSLFKKANDIYIKGSQDICQYNVVALMHEIMYGTKYHMPKDTQKPIDDDNKNALEDIQETTENEEEPDIDKEDDTKNVATSQEENTKQIFKSLQNVQLFFLPINAVSILPNKSKYNKLFHMIYFSNSMVHLFKPEIQSIFMKDCLVACESAKFMLELKKEHQDEFVNRVNNMAEAANCKPTRNFDGKKDNLLTYTYTPSGNC